MGSNVSSPIYTTLKGVAVKHSVESPLPDEVYTSEGPTDYTIMDDVVTPDFKKKIAQGYIINNPMSSHKIMDDHCPPTSYRRTLLNYETDGTMTGNIYDGSYKRPISGHLPPFLPDSTPTCLTALQNQAITQAWGNRSLVVQAVSMTLAEGRKTIQGVYEILFRVIGIAKAAKRLDYKYLMDEISPSELKNRYMELRYAIRPLVIDAQNVIKALQVNMTKVRKTARGGASDQHQDSVTTTERYLWLEKTCTASIEYEISTRAGVLCDIVMSTPSVWGVDQLLETVWEVIPFSFIINWFIDIASLLSSWSPKAGVVERASWVTTLITKKELRSVTMTGNSGSGFDIGTHDWYGQQNRITIIKTRYPEPNRSFFPSVDVNLDALKLLDLGIILKGVMSKKITTFMR
jgi:hypothetical protein